MVNDCVFEAFCEHVHHLNKGRFVALADSVDNPESFRVWYNDFKIALGIVDKPIFTGLIPFLIEYLVLHSHSNLQFSIGYHPDYDKLVYRKQATDKELPFVLLGKMWQCELHSGPAIYLPMFTWHAQFRLEALEEPCVMSVKLSY